MPIVDLDRHDPEHARTLIERAEAHLAEGDRAAAVAALEAAMRHDAFDDDTPLLAAMIHFEDQGLARAATLALTALRIRPFHPSAMHLLGVALLDAGHVGLAQEVLRATVRMAPGYRKAKRNLKRSRRIPRGNARVEMPVEAVRDLLAERDPRIGAVILTREAASDVAGCLASLEGVADEFLVIDATPHGGVRLPEGPSRRLHRFPEQDNDASAPFNAAIRMVSSDWVLVLDARERLQETCVGGRALRDRDALYQPAEVVFTDGGSCAEIRLFRNAAGVHYEGSTEPRLEPALQQLRGRWRIGEGKARFSIDAGRPNRYWDPPTDRQRVERQIEEALLRGPDDAEPRIQRGRLRIACGAMEPALAALTEARAAIAAESIAPGATDAERIVTLEGRALMRLERFEELTRLIRNFHGGHPATRNTLFLEGMAARATGAPAQAAAALQRCLDWKERSSAVPPYPEVLGAGLPTMLGAALMDLGKLEDARDAFEESCEREPGTLEARIGLLGLRLAAGELAELLRELDALIDTHGTESRAWALGANLIGRSPALAPTTEQWLDEACRRFPRDTELRRMLGDARLRAGRAAEALAAWDGLPGRNPDETAARFLAALCCGATLPPIPAGAEHPVELAVVGWLKLWLNWSAYEALDNALLKLDGAATRLAGLPQRTAGWLREIGQDEAAERLQGVLR